MRDAGGNLTIALLLQAYCVLPLHASPHPPQCAHWGTFPPGEGLKKARIAACLRFLCHFQGQLLAAEDVEVQVGNGLAGVGAAVGDHTEALRQALFLGNLADDLEDVGHHGAVLSGDGACIGDGPLAITP